MPFMGGMEATELIRAFELHEGLDRTPIIALTAHASTYILFDKFCLLRLVCIVNLVC